MIVEKSSAKINKAIVFLSIVILVVLFRPSVSFASDPLGSWSSTASLPNLLASHISQHHEGKIFVIGGANVSVIPENLSSSINNDGSLQSWVSSVPSPSIFWHSSVIKDNNIYLLGGANYPPTTSVDSIYIGTIDQLGAISSWTALNPLPGKRALGAAAIVGGRIYYAGGFDSSGTHHQDVYFAPINPDGTLGNWSLAGLLPEPLSGFGMVEHNGNLIILGGFNGNQNRDKTYKIAINQDGSLGPWHETSSLPTVLYRSGIIRVGSTILTIGGVTGSSSVTDKIYYTNINADGSIGGWNTSTNSLPKPLCCAGVAASNNFIYVTGGYSFSDGYLNNVYFTSLSGGGINLAVPLLKQIDPAWGSQVYNSANLWAPSSPGISSWGCALTSAAMVFQYHGIKKLPDGTGLDPGTLNTWLKSQPDGYIRNGLVNWLALSRLSKLAKIINGTSFDALEYKRVNGSDAAQLTLDLQNGRPGILEEPGHFVVGKGVSGPTFTINDPFYPRTDLNPYGNTFLSLGRYLPSATDLSYIMLVVDQNVNVVLKDAQGNSVGETSIQQPLVNDTTGIGTSGQALKAIYYPQPPGGSYQILLSSQGTQAYQLDAYLYDMDGNVNVLNIPGSLSQNNGDVFNINFDKQGANNSHSHRIVTFQNAIQDVIEVRSLNLITQDNISRQLIRLLTQAQEDKQMGRIDSALRRLNHFEQILVRERGGRISEEAYQILIYDAMQLKTQL